MYLINVRTMELEHFQDASTVAVVMLSHRWHAGEVSFEDMQNGTAKDRPGFTKLKSFCEIVQASGHEYGWCDTCCIDKRSSSELSESINSMFRWYQNSTATYAYLADVMTENVNSEDSDFASSVWWTRGWCLQELLAPPTVKFFNQQWKVLGTREGLSYTIGKITHIHYDALFGRDFEDFSIAQRMSWASERVTTRLEDVAYSLMGLFHVNMPLLYGEGDRAFIRLQEEIMKQSDDHSIFMHSSEDSDGDLSLLARSPAAFRKAYNTIPTATKGTGEPYTLTNIGLSIDLPLYPWSLDTYVGVLDCCSFQAPGNKIAIYLTLLPATANQSGPDYAVRTRVDGQAWTTSQKVQGLPKVRKRLYLVHQPPKKLVIPPKRYGFWIRTFGTYPETDGRVWAISWNQWDSDKQMLEMPNGIYGTVGFLVRQGEHENSAVTSLIVRLGFTPTFEPIIEYNCGNKIWQGSQDSVKPVSIESPGVFSGGTQDFKEAKPAAQVMKALSVTRWMKEVDNGSSNQFGCYVKAVNRDAPVEELKKWGHRPGQADDASSAASISCRKEMVDGIQTWVVDIVKRRAKPEELPKTHSFKLPDLKCKGCAKWALRDCFECTSCKAWYLCSECLDLVAVLHKPNHVFRQCRW